MQRQTRYKNRKGQTAESGNLFCLFCRNASPLSLFFSSARPGPIPFQPAVQLSAHRSTFAFASSGQNSKTPGVSATLAQTSASNSGPQCFRQITAVSDRRESDFEADSTALLWMRIVGAQRALDLRMVHDGVVFTQALCHPCPSSRF